MKHKYVRYAGNLIKLGMTIEERIEIFTFFQWKSKCVYHSFHPLYHDFLLSQIGAITKFGFGRTSSWIVLWGTKNQASPPRYEKNNEHIIWNKVFFSLNLGWNTETYVQKKALTSNMPWRFQLHKLKSYMYYLLQRVMEERELILIVSPGHLKGPTRKTFKQSHQGQKWINNG